MGMDYERKSCRLDRRRSKRGSKKTQMRTRSNKQLQRIVRNEDLRLRSLHRRLCQDVKRDSFLPEECAELDVHHYVSEYCWDSYEPNCYASVVVNKFKDDDFCGGVLPRWDRDSDAPREDAYLFVPNDDEMFKTYSVPDFRIEFYFPEDGLWFDQTILKTIAEYIPSFGFRCFKKSREEMKGGIISHGSHSPSVFHYAGIFKREQTFVYNFPTDKQSWDLVICLGNHETRQTDPMLRERHFHVEPTQGQFTISNANILFKFDIGQDEIEAGRTLDWCSVTAFITEANLVLIVYSCSKQQFHSFGGKEYWCWLGDGVYESWNMEFRAVQEVYAYDLDVFLELYLQADDLYDMRFQKYCVFARKLTNRCSYAPVA